jgi:hypothetical protein
MTPQTNKTPAKPASVNPTRAAQAAAEKPAKAAKEPKADPVLNKKIKVITDKGANPKRVGSASHARFAKYKDGMTVSAYLESCGAENRRAARADIAWDSEHKFIELAD